MRAVHAASLFVALLGCTPSARVADTECGSRPTDASLSSLERQALAGSIERTKSSCGPQGERCHFTVSSFDAGISVYGQLAPFKNGQCIGILGGNWIDQYDQSGRYVERLLGM